mgnify:CR=1 FL=1
MPLAVNLLPPPPEQRIPPTGPPPSNQLPSGVEQAPAGGIIRQRAVEGAGIVPHHAVAHTDFQIRFLQSQWFDHPHSKRESGGFYPLRWSTARCFPIQESPQNHSKSFPQVQSQGSRNGWARWFGWRLQTPIQPVNPAFLRWHLPRPTPGGVDQTEQGLVRRAVGMPGPGAPGGERQALFLRLRWRKESRRPAGRMEQGESRGPGAGRRTRYGWNPTLRH